MCYFKLSSLAKAEVNSRSTFKTGAQNGSIPTLQFKQFFFVGGGGSDIVFAELLQSEAELATSLGIWEKTVVDEVMSTMLLPEELLVMTPTFIEAITTCASCMQSWVMTDHHVMKNVPGLGEFCR